VPEDIENYEGGLKAGVMNGRLAFEAAYFQMTEDGVVLSKRQGPFFIPTNAGERKYKGFETGAGWAASTAVSVYFNAGFYHHRYGDFTIESEDGDTVLDGNRLEMSPDHIISWGAVVRPLPPVSATFDVKHVGGVMVNPENEFELNAYTLVDASVSWQVRAFRITLSAHNLFNEEYYWNGGSEAETADPGRPRQVLVTTALRFR
jgi:iron complex outermembrane receptor protein